jgi:2,5-diketo-D-gluconate reductase B
MTMKETSSRTRTLPARDAEIPRLGLGTWRLSGSLCEARVADALAIGYRHVDTAQKYENQREVGRGIRRGGVDREEVFLTSKLWIENLQPDAVVVTTEDSLRELGTDYLDLLLIHWPSDEINLERTLDAMLMLRDYDRIRHLGVSNFPPSWLESATLHAPVVCDQVEYHPFLSQDHLLKPIRERGMALVAYSPLARGRVMEDETLAEIGAAHRRSAAQVALRWLLQQDAVAAIPKASSRDHLEQNLQVFDFALSAEEMQSIHDLAERGERTVDPDFAPRWER